MSITRIGEFQARRESIEELRDFLISIVPGIKSFEGCESVQLYQGQDNPAKFTIIEVWDGIESHQASVRNISSEDLARVRPMLAAAPSGSYFQLVQEK